MRRHLLQKLLDWQKKTARKPLILMGARQVGKTTLLKHFGDIAYQNTVYLNFELEPHLKQLFQFSLIPQQIIRSLEIEKNVRIQPDTTLIIFDEIQECPEALNSLKYFCELANEYMICAAGSLLGVKLTHIKGFPVGKADFMHLYPLNFLEFLDALQQDQLVAYIHDIQDIQPLFVNIHNKLLEYLKLYLFIGGMPEAIVRYINTDDLTQVREIQQTILTAYGLDFAKHAPKHCLMKINLVWDSIPAQLAKENKKFIYSLIRTGARAKEFEDSLQWLIEAGLIHKVPNISTPGIPLKSYAHFEFFKIYLLDVGLLSAMTNLSAQTLLYGDLLFQEFKGSLVENFVVQELAHHYDCYYWSSEGKAELDFIIQDDKNILPIEVKSGTSHHKKSLQVYANKYDPTLLIRISLMNLKQDNRVLNCPIYLAGMLGRLMALED